MKTLLKIYFSDEISSAHKLSLPYESPCNELHGHNYKIELEIFGVLNKNGMIIDFSIIKKELKKLDHKYLNEIIENPTVENIAYRLLDQFKELEDYKNISKIIIRIWEDTNSYAELVSGD